MRIEQLYEDHNIGQLGFNPNVKSGDNGKVRKVVPVPKI